MRNNRPTRQRKIGISRFGFALPTLAGLCTCCGGWRRASLEAASGVAGFLFGMEDTHETFFFCFTSFILEPSGASFFSSTLILTRKQLASSNHHSRSFAGRWQRATCMMRMMDATHNGAWRPTCLISLTKNTVDQTSRSSPCRDSRTTKCRQQSINKTSENSRAKLTRFKEVRLF